MSPSPSLYDISETVDFSKPKWEPYKHQSFFFITHPISLRFVPDGLHCWNEIEIYLDLCQLAQTSNRNATNVICKPLLPLFFPCMWVTVLLFIVEEKEEMWRILLQKASSAILSFHSENDKTSFPRKSSYLIVNPNLISKFTHLLPLFIKECRFPFSSDFSIFSFPVEWTLLTSCSASTTRRKPYSRE